MTLDLDAGYPDISRGSPQSLKENNEPLPYNKP
jgi:hypothetical protein